MTLATYKYSTGNVRMKPWCVLVEATIQEVKIQGTITVHTTSEEAAKKTACSCFINHLRLAGIWTHIDEIDEPYEVEVEGPKDEKTGKSTKKMETKYRKITRYHAPYWDHVKALEIIEDKSRDLTFSTAELEEAAIGAKDIVSHISKKRRTTSKVALDNREKKQTSIAKKKERLEKKKEVVANKQSKDELLKAVEKYFTGDDAKVIKVAAGELNQVYQRVRYALFQIKDKGYNGTNYELIQTKIDGSTAFKLIIKGSQKDETFT